MTLEDQATWSILPSDLLSLATHCDAAGQATISSWLTAMDLRNAAMLAKSDATPAQLRYLAGLTGVKRDEWEWEVCIPFEDCSNLIDELVTNGSATYRGTRYHVTTDARKSSKRTARKTGRATTTIPF